MSWWDLNNWFVRGQRATLEYLGNNYAGAAQDYLNAEAAAEVLRQQALQGMQTHIPIHAQRWQPGEVNRKDHLLKNDAF